LRCLCVHFSKLFIKRLLTNLGPGSRTCTFLSWEFRNNSALLNSYYCSLYFYRLSNNARQNKMPAAYGFRQSEYSDFDERQGEVQVCVSLEEIAEALNTFPNTTANDKQ